MYANYGRKNRGNASVFFFFSANSPWAMDSGRLLGAAGVEGQGLETDGGQRGYARRLCTIRIIISSDGTERGKGQLLLFPGERCCRRRALARVPRRRRSGSGAKVEQKSDDVGTLDI